MRSAIEVATAVLSNIQPCSACHAVIGTSVSTGAMEGTDT